MNKYLTEVEQYKEVLSQDEISRIHDPALKEIRWKYWKKRHELFLDEQGCSDAELNKQMDRIIAQETEEIEKFKSNQAILS